MELKIILEHGDDSMIVARCPSLQSCWSQGRTRDEALQNICEAIDLYLEPDGIREGEHREVIVLTL